MARRPVVSVVSVAAAREAAREVQTVGKVGTVVVGRVGEVVLLAVVGVLLAAAVVLLVAGVLALAVVSEGLLRAVLPL